MEEIPTISVETDMKFYEKQRREEKNSKWKSHHILPASQTIFWLLCKKRVTFRTEAITM